MSFRFTSLLFGLLLGLLWIFGLILALNRSAFDPSHVFPKFSQGTRGDINYVEVAKNGKPYCVFTKTKVGKTDYEWRLKLEGHPQDVRANENEIESLISEVRGARHSNQETDVGLNRNLEAWGLTAPRLTITIKNAEGGEWQLRVGKESADNAFAFVNSNERSRDVLAVRRSTLGNVFKVFSDDINSFRLKRLWSAVELNPRSIELKETRDGKELSLEKINDRHWWFKTPALGPADLENLPTAKTDLPAELKGLDKLDQSTRSLLASLTNLRVDGFEPIDGTMTIDPQKALLRIELGFEAMTGAKDEKIKGKTEVLLIGDKVLAKDEYYARMADDNSIVRVSSKAIDSVLALIKDPRPLRSRDLAFFDEHAVDAVEIQRGQELAKLFKGKEGWRVFSPDAEPKAGSESLIAGNGGVIAAILGRQAIGEKDFEDADSAEKLKALEAKFAPDKVDAKVVVYTDSLQPEPEKKDAKKDDKKEDKKDEKAGDKKDDKKAEEKTGPEKQADKKDDKAEDKQDAKAPPKFKDGVKPAVALYFVKQDKDKVLVKRELILPAPKDDKEKKQETTVSFFSLPVATYDKIVPRDMAMAFFDTNIKSFSSSDAIKLQLTRAPAKDRDKLTETFLLELQKVQEKDKEAGKKEDAKDSDKKKDEAKKADDPQAAKDQKKDEKKEGPDAGQKDKEAKSEWKLLEPKEFVGKGQIEAAEVSRVLDELANLRAVRWVQKASSQSLDHYGLDDKHWSVRVSITPKKKEGDKEDPKPFVIRFGEASNRDTDKGAVFAFLEGTEYVFLLESRIDKLLKEVEFRDRHVLKFEPSKVKELRVFVATADKEIRKPVFERAADKTWKDKKEVLGFKIDTRRVDDLVDKLADLQVIRYLNVAKGELPKEYELGDNAPLKFEVLMDDDKTIHTVTVGASSEKNGPYYGQCSALPGHVFLLGRDPYNELMGKVTYFRKD